MRKLLLIFSLFIAAFSPAGSYAAEKITVIPVLPENAVDTYNLGEKATVLFKPLADSGIFTVWSQQDIDNAAEFGIDPAAQKTNLTIQLFTFGRGQNLSLILSLRDISGKELNWVEIPLAEADDENVLIRGLVRLLPVLQASATCESWQENITSDLSLPMQEAMDELAYRLMGCHIVSASERESSYLKYATTKNHAASLGLITAGLGSIIFATAGWCWVAGAPEDVGGYVIGGVFSAAAVATLASGIPLAVKYSRGKKERKALDKKKVQGNMLMTPVINQDYQGLQLALTW